jgi:hypothetical protein
MRQVFEMSDPLLRCLVAHPGFFAHLRTGLFAYSKEDILGSLEIEFRYYCQENLDRRFYSLEQLDIGRRTLEPRH